MCGVRTYATVKVHFMERKKHQSKVYSRSVGCFALRLFAWNQGPEAATGAKCVSGGTRAELALTYTQHFSLSPGLVYSVRALLPV